ncbi:MAG: hypothetical protein AAF630_04800 [Cyanobacteria bacterium P01_C01_bin.38]
MNNTKSPEGLSQQKEKLEKSRANVIKIIQTRFKQVPNEVIQVINTIDNESVLEKLFTISIIVADFEDFQKRLEELMSKK